MDSARLLGLGKVRETCHWAIKHMHLLLMKADQLTSTLGIGQRLTFMFWGFVTLSSTLKVDDLQSYNVMLLALLFFAKGMALSVLQTFST